MSKEWDEAVADMTATAKTTQETYNAAKGYGLFPEYNGLVGLIKGLSNYATFNSFTMSSIINNKDYNSNEAIGEQVYGDVIDDLFPQTEDDYVENAASEADEGSARIKAERAAQSKVDAVDSAYNGSGHPGWLSRREYLRDLLRFQAETVQSALLKKLSLNDAEELRNYIIPKGGYVETRDSEETTDASVVSVILGADIYKQENIYRNNQAFIRWDALAILINEALIPTNEDGKNPLHIITDRVYDAGGNRANFSSLNYASITEYNEETGERNVFDFSTDPNVCMLPTQLFYMPKKIAEDVFGYLPRNGVFPKEYMIAVHGKDSMETYYDGKILKDDAKLSTEDKFSRIGSIWLNIGMLNNIVDKNGNDEDYTIGNFINDIWKEVNKACPNHNFVLTDDKEANNIFIIDLPVDQGNLPKTYHTFIPFSNKNIFREFDYTSNVPNAMSATIAIQSQDPRSIQDIDGVTFAAFNKSIKNRILSKDTKPSWDKVKEDVESNASNLNKRRRELRKILEAYNLNFIKNLSLEASGLETLGDSNIAGVLKEYQQSGTYVQKALGIKSSFTSVIPLDFNATLDGISGIVIGNMFKIQKDRLPKAYAKADIGFIVFSEEQKITAGGDWTTDIGGKMVMLEQDSNYTNIPIDRNPPAVESVEEKELVQALEDLGQNYALSTFDIEVSPDGNGFSLIIQNNDGQGDFAFEAPGPIYSDSPNTFQDGVVIPSKINIERNLPEEKEFRIYDIIPTSTTIANKVSGVILQTPRIVNVIFTPDTITMKTIKYAAMRASAVEGEEVDMRSAPGDDIIILLGNDGPILRESVSTGGGYKDHYLGKPGEVFSFPSDASRAARRAEKAEELEEVNEEIKAGIHPDAVEVDALTSPNDGRLGFYIETQGTNSRVVARGYGFVDNDGVPTPTYTDIFTSEFIDNADPNTLIQFAKFKMGSEELVRDSANDSWFWGNAYKVHNPYKVAISKGTLTNPFA